MPKKTASSAGELVGRVLILCENNRTLVGQSVGRGGRVYPPQMV
jgi:hypothetical protein